MGKLDSLPSAGVISRHSEVGVDFHASPQAIDASASEERRSYGR